MYSLYILRFLHQTTTADMPHRFVNGCISCVFYIKPQLCSLLRKRKYSCISCVFYIKPQPVPAPPLAAGCCISCVFYIKPQPKTWCLVYWEVVYLAFSTSNHNILSKCLGITELYILRFLHQTTTGTFHLKSKQSCISCVFYIKPQLDGDLAVTGGSCISCVFYIKPQPFLFALMLLLCCISCVFYIKPQHTFLSVVGLSVVYLAFSTSNHNTAMPRTTYL